MQKENDIIQNVPGEYKSTFFAQVDSLVLTISLWWGGEGGGDLSIVDMVPSTRVYICMFQNDSYFCYMTESSGLEIRF